MYLHTSMGLPASLNMVEMVWPRLLKNKYGTVDHAELIRHFGRQQRTVSHSNRSRTSRLSSSKKYKKLKAMVRILNTQLHTIIVVHVMLACPAYTCIGGNATAVWHSPHWMCACWSVPTLTATSVPGTDITGAAKHHNSPPSGSLYRACILLHYARLTYSANIHYDNISMLTTLA